MAKAIAKLMPIAFLSVIAACSGGAGNKAGDSANDYTHPGKGGGGGTQANRQREMATGESAADTELTLGTTTVTVRNGTFAKQFNVLLSEFGGFLESDDIRLLSKPVLLNITSDETTLTRADALLDIEVEIAAVKAAPEKNLVVLLREGADLATGAETAMLTNSAIASEIAAVSTGLFKVNFRIRSPEIAFALAKSDVVLPPGYAAFDAPPKPVTDLSATATSLNNVQVTFKARSLATSRFALAYSNNGSAPDCELEDIIAPVETPETLTVSAILAGFKKTGLSTYNYALTGLTGGTTYQFRLCVFNSRTPADVSAPSATVEVQMPEPVQATLTGTPLDLSSTSTLNVTVGGTDVLLYRYALRQGSLAGDCDGATYSDWITVATPIADALSSDDTYRLCVLGKFSESNYQINPTVYAWTKMADPAFTSVDLANAATDGYLSAADRLLTSAIAANLTGTNFDSAGYAVVSDATACDGSLTYSTSVPAANETGITGDGLWKICVKLSRTGSNILVYGASNSFEVDTGQPVFTSLALINDAVDGTVSVAERGNTTALGGTLVATGYDAVAYKLAPGAASCNGSLTYGAMPQSDSGDYSGDGAYQICVQLSDTAGNIVYGTTAALTFALDPVFVSFDLLNAAADGYLNAADRALGTAVAGNLVANQYSSADYAVVTNATSCNGSLTYSGSIPVANGSEFSIDDTYKICIRLTNLPGGATVYAASSSITVDVTLPSFTSVALANDVTDNILNLQERANTTSLTGSVSGSGYETAHYALVSDVTVCDGLLTYGAAITSDSSVFGADGNYKVCVRLSDGAQNPVAYGGSGVFALLTVAPTFTSLDLLNDAADGYINIQDHGNTNDLAGNLIASGQTSEDYALVSSATSCAGPLTYGTLPKSNASGFGSNGTYKVCVRLVNGSGNFAYGATANFSLDLTAPVFTSLALGNDATDGFITAAEMTNALDLAGTLTASGQSSTDYALVTNATLCNAPPVYASAVPKADSVVLASDGLYKICVRLQDLAGNQTYGASAAIERDTAAPSFTSLALANEATDGYINISDRALANPLAGTLTASGQSSTQYAIATNAQACSDGGLTWGASVPAADSSVFGADGTYKVCVKLTDAASNITYGSSADIVYDQTAPAYTSIPLANAATDAKINFAESSLGTAVVGGVVGSGYDTVGYKVVTPTSTVCSVQSGYSTTVPTPSGGGFPSDAIYKVCIELTDLAGNSPAYGSSGAISVDATLPTSSISTSGALTPDSTAGSTTVISGTASDTGTLAQVEISLQKGSGFCLNAGKTDFDAACPNYINATTPATWSVTINDALLFKGETYNISARARDSFSNYQSPVATGSFTWSPAEGADLWNAAVTYNSSGSAHDEVKGSAVDSSGNLYLAGYVTGTDTNWRIKKYSKYGTEITTGWNKTYDHGSGNDAPYSVAVDSADNVYVTGSVDNGTDLDWHIKKFDSSGTEITTGWNKTIDSTFGDDELLSVAVDSSDNVYVGGYGTNVHDGSATGTDWWVIKYNSAGTQQCQIAVDIGGDADEERVQALVVDSTNGYLYVVGWETVSGVVGWRIGKYNSSNCAAVTDVATAWGSADRPAAAGLDGSGNLYVAGSTSQYGSADWALVKYTSALATSCTLVANDSGINEPSALRIDSNNNVYVAGYRNSSSSNESAWIRQFTTTCTEDTTYWNNIFDVNSGNDRVTTIALGRGTDDADNLYAIGFGTNVVGGSTGKDWWMKKFSKP